MSSAVAATPAAVGAASAVCPHRLATEDPGRRRLVPVPLPWTGAPAQTDAGAKSPASTRSGRTSTEISHRPVLGLSEGLVRSLTGAKIGEWVITGPIWENGMGSSTNNLSNLRQQWWNGIPMFWWTSKLSKKDPQSVKSLVWGCLRMGMCFFIGQKWYGRKFDLCTLFSFRSRNCCKKISRSWSSPCHLFSYRIRYFHYDVATAASWV